jgi:hypothetical protein
MTSYVEITDAWTAPGDVKGVSGYLYPVDGCSVGYFQQQADDLGCGTFGWGKRDQLIRAPFALQRFLDEAVRIQDDYGTSPQELGRLCADVQRPLESLRNLYWTKGYPAAMELLGGDSGQTSWPSEEILFDSSGWAYIGNDWLKGPPGLSLKTDGNGWLYKYSSQFPPTGKCEWPQADEPPRVGDYVARHPLRFTWRADVEAWACYLNQNYDVACNTYYDHPEGYFRDADSIDIWGPGGRGDPINYYIGQQIFEELFWDEGLPNIEWIIWQRTIYGAWNGWSGEAFGDGTAFTNHDDHIHVTYA